jgi:hypothetical protein
MTVVLSMRSMRSCHRASVALFSCFLKRAMFAAELAGTMMASTIPQTRVPILALLIYKPTRSVKTLFMAKEKPIDLFNGGFDRCVSRFTLVENGSEHSLVFNLFVLKDIACLIHPHISLNVLLPYRDCTLAFPMLSYCHGERHCTWYSNVVHDLGTAGCALWMALFWCAKRARQARRCRR